MKNQNNNYPPNIIHGLREDLQGLETMQGIWATLTNRRQLDGLDEALDDAIRKIKNQLEEHEARLLKELA